MRKDLNRITPEEYSLFFERLHYVHQEVDGKSLFDPAYVILNLCTKWENFSSLGFFSTKAPSVSEKGCSINACHSPGRDNTVLDAACLIIAP